MEQANVFIWLLAIYLLMSGLSAGQQHESVRPESNVTIAVKGLN